MSVFNIVTISMALAIVFTGTVLPLHIKNWLGKNPFDFVKPWDCTFCMANWFAILIAATTAPNITTGITAWACTILIAKLYEKFNA